MTNTNTNNYKAPSTPPNTTNPQSNQPQSTRCESSRMRTPSSRPGFIATQSNSCRELVPPLPKVKQKFPIPEDDSDKSDQEIIKAADTVSSPKKGPAKGPGAAQNATILVKQVASRTGQGVTVDLEQNSDNENNRVLSQKRKEKTKDKDGFDHPPTY
ncbi:hypothetical protein PtB15_5B385 [Puccinia triticina]|nr:hypothetical protein PtB15_5B385 [Puccinia triticina]